MVLVQLPVLISFYTAQTCLEAMCVRSGPLRRQYQYNVITCISAYSYKLTETLKPIR